MFERASRLIALTVAPILLGLAALSDDFTIGVLGPHWAAMALPLALLATSALVNSLHTLVGAAIEASGRVSFEVFTQGTYALLIVVGTIVGARYGIVGVSVAVLISSIIHYVLKAVTIHLALDMPMKRFVRPMLGPLAAAGAMYLAVRFGLDLAAENVAALAPEHHIRRLLFGATVGIVSYSVLLPIVARQHLHLLREQIGRLRHEIQPASASSGMSPR
jgi:O-antigen/teichoic acid export membrane protein